MVATPGVADGSQRSLRAMNVTLVCAVCQRVLMLVCSRVSCVKTQSKGALGRRPGPRRLGGKAPPGPPLQRILPGEMQPAVLPLWLHEDYC